MKKKKDKKGISIFNVIVVAVVVVIGIISVIRKESDLKVSSVTKCTVTKIGYSPGRGSRSKKIYFEYVVNGHVYTGEAFKPSNIEINVGDCYMAKYSVNKPETIKVLFKKGKVSCE